MIIDSARQIARTALSLLDLTSLNDSDSDATIEALANAADTPFGPPAALCVYPRFIGIARAALDQRGLGTVAVATVSNFPAGGTDLDQAVAETRAAADLGATEVDVVFPWRALRHGDADIGKRLVAGCRAVLPPAVLLKVIIESGELASPPLIDAASRIAIEQGADFIKTSTGKVPVNATLAAAEIMLQRIKDSGATVGFKASGGVRSVGDAGAYLALASGILGEGWITPRHFRFGASSLLADIIALLTDAARPAALSQGY